MSGPSAEELFTKTLTRSLLGWRMVGSFRSVAKAASSSAPPILLAENTASLTALIRDGTLQAICTNIDEVMPKLGGFAGMVVKATAQQLVEYEFAVDAASLVFSHSILDGIVHDYCRTAFLADVTAWESQLKDRKTTLAEVKNGGYEGVLRAKAETYVDALGRESLMTKLNAIMAICGSGGASLRTEGYTYDLNRIESLDERRHKVVHGFTVSSPLPKGDDDLRYMQRTAVYCGMLIGKRFGLKCDANKYPPDWAKNATPSA